MNPDALKIRELFVEAVGKVAPEAWDAFLDQACGDRPELRREVHELLRAHQEAGSFLRKPAAELAATCAHTPSPTNSSSETVLAPDGSGTVIGPYKLLRQIGEGGMGTVWLAEQTHPVQRMVALKLIKSGLDSQQIIARFEAERQALALMDHPNIAKVLDAGTFGEPGRVSAGSTRGADATPLAARPYFVMELVNGVPITEYCDEHRLTPKQRLELFVPVCQAVQHAHQKGIIHRDIKPSNVLVCLYDGKPVPKVIDFGVAKAAGPKLTDKTLHTEFGAIVGTLEYMSPEQAQLDALDIDTRCDIYSLGVLLYELLTGTTPLDRKRLKEIALLELLRRVREEEAPRPSTRLSTADGLPSIAANRGSEPKKLTVMMRGELDWIVLKCLEKDRNRRYETANGFAADVLRYLADEPVQACPPSAVYRLRKFARRNKGPVLAAGLVALALLAGVIGTALALIQARRERGSAIAARDEAESAKKAAQVNESIAQAVAQFLMYDLLGQADTEVQPDVGRDPDVKVRTLLDRASQRIEGKFQDMPLVEAAIREVIGSSYRGLGLSPEAKRHLERSTQIRTSLLGADHPVTLRTRFGIALVYSWQSKFAEAGALSAEILQAQTRRLGANHIETLRTKGWLGRIYYDLGRYPDAEATLKETLDVMTAHFAADHWNTLGTKQTLALVSMAERNPDQAERLLNEVVQGWTKKEGADYRQTLIAKTTLGWLYTNQKKHAAAETLLKDTLDVLTKTLGADHPDTLNCKHDLATTFMYMRKDAEAERLFKEVIEARIPKEGARHRDTLASKNNLANVYVNQKRYADAEKLYQEVIQAETATLGPNHPDTLRSKYDRADLLLRKDPSKWAEALEVFRADLAARREQHPDEASAGAGYLVDLGEKQHNLGMFLADMHRWPEALESYQKEAGIGEKLAAAFPANEPYQRNLASAYCNFGNTLLQSGNPAESLSWYAKAIAILEPLAIKRKPGFETTCQFLHITYNAKGAALEALNRRDEALDSFRAALANQEKLATEFPAPDNQLELAMNYINLGIQFNDRRMWPEAEQAHRAALPILEKLIKDSAHVPLAQLNLGANFCNLGNVLRDSGKPEESLDWYAKALAGLEPIAAGKGTLKAKACEYQRNTHSARARALEKLNRDTEALDDHRAGLTIGKKLADEFPLEPNYRVNLAGGYNDLGILLLKDRGKIKEALDSFRQALKVQEKLASDFKDAPGYQRELATGYSNLGHLLRDQRMWEQAQGAHRAALQNRRKLIERFNLPDDRVALGGDYCNLGNALSLGGKPQESLEWFAKAITVLDPLLAAKGPPADRASRFKRNVYLGRAQALDKLKRHSEAVADLERVVELSEPRQQPQLRAVKAESLLRAGRVADAVAEVEELTKLKGWDNAALYNFACIYAVAAAKDKTHHDEYAQRALALLRQAVQAGFKDVAHMKEDEDLDALRNRADFKKLLADLEAGSAKE